MPEMLLPGTEVEARGLQWEVVSSQQLGPQTLYRLRGLLGAVKGREIDLLHPFEGITPIRADLCPERATTIRNWLVYHQAFLLEQAFGPDTLLAVQPGRLRLEPYQLVPVMRALRMSRVRLLLADGVGLGKSVEAGLVITELMARRLAHRLLIVSPAGVLLEQWRTEMLERFGLRLEVIDRAKLEDVRRQQELGANPFDFIPLGLVSIDFLKQERVLQTLERASYDIIVIDEAHHCGESGAGADRDDTERRRLAAGLARSCDALLLLTATPHDGYDRSFSSLVELLDPSLIDGRGNVRGDRYKNHVIRRLKSHLGDKFKLRHVKPIPVTPSDKDHPDFVLLQRKLLDLVAPQLRRAFHNKEYSEVLSFISLLKRSVSTVAACNETLSVIATRFEEALRAGAEEQVSRRERRRALRDLRRKVEHFGMVSEEEEREHAELEAEDFAHQLADIELEIRRGTYRIEKAASVAEALSELSDLAIRAAAQDPKLAALKSEIQDIRKESPNANVLIYSEYTDSQEVIAKYLTNAKLGTILRLSGNDSDKDRKNVTELFRTRDGLVLVSTDAAAEGLNLHQRCHHLIHVELPWNPNRLEQRNGRIDRYGQEHEPIIRYLYLRGTFEERILLRLIAKYERQRELLTFVPNTLGITSTSDASAARLLKCFMDEDTKLFTQEETLFKFGAPEESDPSDPATKELIEEIDRSLRAFQQASRTNAWLGVQGLNAEKRLLDEAEAAQKVGENESVDLAAFVLDAIRLDGGSVERDGGIFRVKLPSTWLYGLDEIPGYDSDEHCIRLTTDMDVTRDASNNTVGFLGRAHPLVRRALDRVRTISFGGEADRGQDQRVSAVKADVAAPQLLVTFLGRVSSGKGREFERVLAVRMGKAGCIQCCTSSNEWRSLADPDNGISTRDVWKKRFADWGDSARAAAMTIALDAFTPMAAEFTSSRGKDLEDEKKRQQEWLAQRCEEITAAAGAEPPEAQPGLFDDKTAPVPKQDWRRMKDPFGKLSAFASERAGEATFGKYRREAETVLRIYRKRIADLNAHLNLAAPEVHLLGLLMIVPAKEVKSGS